MSTRASSRQRPGRSALALALALFGAMGCRDGSRAPTNDTAGTSAEAPARKRPVRGITGKTAPPLELSSWFNVADGVRPEVADYRGKVVFLFFFQSW